MWFIARLPFEDVQFSINNHSPFTMQTPMDVLCRHAEVIPDRILYTFLPDDGLHETLTLAELDRRFRALREAISEIPTDVTPSPSF